MSTWHKQHSLGEKNEFTLYMFEEDLKMIKRWADEPFYSGKRPNGGYLLGLWTNTLNPVVHIVFKDDSAAEDYLLLKSPQLKKEKALSMFSRIGYWSFERKEHECFQDTRFVFLEVEMKYPVRSSAFHPVLLFKGQISRGKIEPLKGKNPFMLPEELTNLASQDEKSKEEKSEGVVASIWKKFESGVTKVAEAISGSMQESTRQAPTLEQSYQDKESASDISEMPKDVSTCTKGNQWYLTEKGQKTLQEISEKLGEVVNDETKISRDNDTHNVMILFMFNNKSYVISFPPNFSELNATLYSFLKTRNNRSYASPIELKERDPIFLVEEVINKLS